MPWRLVLACTAVIAGCGGGGAAPQSERPYVTLANAGLTIALRDGWRALPARDGNIVDPVTRFAIASGAPRAAVPGCQTQITNYAPGRDAVSLVIVEWQQSDDIGPRRRPGRFDEDSLPAEAGTIECFRGRGGMAAFSERGRFFGAYLLLGEHADPELAEEARAVLDTFRVEVGR